MRGVMIGVLFVSGCRAASPGAASQSPAPEPEVAATQDEAPASKPADPFVDIGVIKSRAIHAPDPPTEELRMTKAARKKKPVSTTVGFCVDTSGVPQRVVTWEESGDPRVDWICRNTVSDWRFTPFTTGGKPANACSSVTFEINFQ